MENTITKIAMDMHKKQHVVAWVNQNSGEAETFSVPNRQADIRKMVKKLAKQCPGQLHFCYEAGVCGFTLRRQLEALGCQCDVIAPSLIPTKRGDRIKTDRRDAKKLLELFTAGQLTAVYPPNLQQEADRELTRCRYAAQVDLKRIRHQLIKFLDRHGYMYHDGKNWTQKHMRWLRSLAFDHDRLRSVFDHYMHELEHATQRRDMLDQDVEALAQSPAYQPIVGTLRCFRGIDTLTAITLITEIFEFGRFDSPRKLMLYLGLVPSEYSSGEASKRGGITKTGNKRVRQLLVESAWHSRHRVGVSEELKARRKGQPPWAITIADKAMARLHKRYWSLIERGKMKHKVVVAIAREFAGFIWAALREYQLRQGQQAAPMRIETLTCML